MAFPLNNRVADVPDTTNDTPDTEDVEDNEDADTDPSERRRPVTELDWLTAGGIAVTFYLVALWRLAEPPKMIFDEIYHARTGMQYIWGTSLTEWTHPPLAKLLIALSMLCWRVHFDPREGVWNEKWVYPEHMAFAWRFPSLLFGTASLVVLYVLARAMFGRREIATVATCLLALDGVFFVQSRVAMTNIFTVFFVLLSSLGTYHYLKTSRLSYLLLTGLGIGLALATRWSTLYIWGLTWLALLYHLFKVLLPRATSAAKARNLTDGQFMAPWLFTTLCFFAWAGVALFCLIVIPLILYTLAYIPDVLQGGGDWKIKLFTLNGLGGQQSWAWTLGVKPGMLQNNMWSYHAHIKDSHPYSSKWYTWPIMYRPVWYYFDTDAQGMTRGVWSIGNGFIWWLSVPAMVTAAWMGWRERNKALGLIALLGLGQWLMWGVEPRPLIFMHYYFESIPYACLALAFLGWRLWERGGPWGRAIVGGLAFLTVVWAIFFYPLLSAYPVSSDFYQRHMWTGHWI